MPRPRRGCCQAAGVAAGVVPPRRHGMRPGRAPRRRPPAGARARRAGSDHWPAGSADERRSPTAGRADWAPRLPRRCAACRSTPDRALRRAACACTDAAGCENRRRVGASSTMRPRYITPTRSAMWCTTARLCEMNRNVRPSSRCRRRMRLSTCACTDTSSAEVGSSQTRNAGLPASARAIEMRWRWPPGELVRKLCAVGGGEADLLEQARYARGARARRLSAARSAQRLGDDVGDAPARIEARVGILEDHLHVAPLGPGRRHARRCAARHSESRRGWAR